MRAVNLLPANVDANGPSRRPPLPILVALGGVALLMGYVPMSVIGASGAVGDRRAELAAVQTQLAALPNPEPEATSPVLAQLAQERGRRATAVTTALGQRVPFDRILRQVSKVLPDDVWLEALTADAPVQGAVDGAAAGLTVTGYTSSLDGVARLLARLEVVPDLTDVTLGSSTVTDLEGRNVLQFTISASISPPGVTP